MWFWLKHLTAAAILLIAAFVLLFNPNILTSPPAATKPIASSASVPGSAAEGFTNFYQMLRYSLDASRDRAKEFIIELPDTSDQLSSTLTARTNTVPALDPKWTGKSQQRKFEAGSKLRDQMAAYASTEGIELFWTLPRDYVVKHYFQSDSNYLTTLKNIASAIAPDFQTPVLVFFCPKERAAVVTDKCNPFLDTECTQLNLEPPPATEPAAN